MIRRKLIEAHHVEHLQNRGAIGAKNLIVLCAFHHNLVGDQLSSIAVIKALSAAKRINRSFPTNPEGTAFNNQDGLIAEIKTDSAPFRVLLFFTIQHAEAWTRLSREDSPTVREGSRSTRSLVLRDDGALANVVAGDTLSSD